MRQLFASLSAPVACSRPLVLRQHAPRAGHAVAAICIRCLCMIEISMKCASGCPISVCMGVVFLLKESSSALAAAAAALLC